MRLTNRKLLARLQGQQALLAEARDIRCVLFDESLVYVRHCGTGLTLALGTRAERTRGVQVGVYAT